MGERPANLGGVFLVDVPNRLKPGAVGKDESLIALAALVDEDDDGQIGSQALEELRRVLGFLAFTVAHKVHGHFVKTRFAFELLANAQDQSRPVRVDLFDLGHEDELTAG